MVLNGLSVKGEGVILYSEFRGVIDLTLHETLIASSYDKRRDRIDNKQALLVRKVRN